MSFSFLGGLPIAMISSETCRHSILNIESGNEEKKGRTNITDLFNYLGEDYAKNDKLKPADVDKIRRALNDGYKIEERELKSIFKKIKKQIEEKTKKEFYINEGTLTPIPDYKTRDTYYISGPSGIGKSTITRKIIRQWMKEYPGRPIYLFSKLKEDPSLDSIGDLLQRIPIDEEWIENPPEVEDVDESSMCIFDDIDTIEPKKVRNAVKSLQDQILQVGRHRNIYCISTTHKMCNHQKTGVLLEEARKIIFFPRGGNKSGINRMLTTYVGLDKKDAARVMNLPSRWVMVSKSFPMYVMYETGAFIL